MISYKYLKRRLTYCKATGVFRWKSVKEPGHERWNGRYAGEVAGGLSSHGHRRISLNGKRFNASVLAWFYVKGQYPKFYIDHKNMNAGDDRWSNLRQATNSQNMANTVARNKLMVKGVTPRGKKFNAGIMCEGRRFNLGRFDTAKEAHGAYKEAAKRLFGEYARF